MADTSTSLTLYERLVQTAHKLSLSKPGSAYVHRRDNLRNGLNGYIFLMELNNDTERSSEAFQKRKPKQYDEIMSTLERIDQYFIEFGLSKFKKRR